VLGSDHPATLTTRYYLAQWRGQADGAPSEQFAELRALDWVEAAVGARDLLEENRVLDPGLVQDEVLPAGRPLAGRDPFADQVRH
jgi:hypothetical protein